MKFIVMSYTDMFYKIVHEVPCESMAKEYVECILRRGDFYTDGEGNEVYIPIHRIQKVKIIKEAGEPKIGAYLL